MDCLQSSFVSLPVELRLAVYELLLVSHGERVLCIRNEDSLTYSLLQNHRNRRRSSFWIMADSNRTSGLKTSYILTANPGIFPAILATNQQIYGEASHLLYSSHVFDFDQDIECIVPFLGDLMPLTRTSVKSINLTQMALPHVIEFDRYEWRNACDFISRHLKLEHLGLGVVGGKPAHQWESWDTFAKSDFPVITKFDSMEWVEQVAAIKGLQSLTIKAHMKHWKPPQSNAMTFFVNFSASIDKGFAEYLKDRMVAEAA